MTPMLMTALLSTRSCITATVSVSASCARFNSIQVGSIMATAGAELALEVVSAAAANDACIYPGFWRHSVTDHRTAALSDCMP